MSNFTYKDLIIEIFGCDPSIDWSPELKLKNIVMNSALRDREAKFLIARYFEGKVLETIAKENSITKERVRQIIMKALKKCRHPSRSKKFLNYLNPVACALEDIQNRLKLIERHLQPVSPDNKDNSNLNLGLREVELSVRLSNCLREAGCKTLGDVCEKTPYEILNYKNLGPYSLKELIAILAQYNLKLKVD